jgi:crotonobetaine/carnitine-CoA ligase
MDRRFSPAEFWPRMARLGATHVWSFGSMTPLLQRAPLAASDREHAVRVLWSIPWPATGAREFEERFGLSILSGYGSTEQGLTIVQPADHPVPGTLGRPTAAYEVRLVGEDDEEVVVGEPGEIVIRPREPFSMMSGYLGRDEATLEVWRNLWYHTGDLARERPDGYLEFVERSNDAIRRRGENISAFELESSLAVVSGIDEVAAIGVPSELGDQDVMLVLTERGEGIDPRELYQRCCELLPYYMVPRYIRVVPELPKTPSLRVQKFLLRADGVTPDTWDAEAHGLRVRRPAEA